MHKKLYSLSLTGKLLYPIVDRFLVHWEELYQDYPRSELISTSFYKLYSAYRRVSFESFYIYHIVH